MNDILRQKIKMLPSSPGVYVMLGADGTVIYVGKAKVLKNRVSQYFHSSPKPEKVAAMVSNIEDFYYIITTSEIDALSLENNLIKKYKPKYNILLKDDKTYPYIKVDLRSDFPTFSSTRSFKRDGNRYFGPFMGGVNVSDTLAMINAAFPLRTCSKVIDPKSPVRPCLNYFIGKCCGPCGGATTKEEYKKLVDGALDFLSGDDDVVEKILIEKMTKCAEIEEFELAASYRDKLKMLEKIKLRRLTSLNRFVDADVVSTTENGLYSAVNVLFIRGGRMQGGKNFAYYDAEDGNASRLYSFVSQYYSDGTEIPDEIILSERTDDEDLLVEFLRERRGKSVKITVPEKGEKKKLVEMSTSNARDFLEKEIDRIRRKDEITTTACKRLKSLLSLKKYPKRIECYDISHLSGVDKVGSMVVFTDGEADKNEYRRFKIKTVEGSDDFACLKEVLTRRLSKLGTQEEEKFARPDLVIIDGGKGQLSAVKEVFDELGITDVDLASIAKQNEEIFTLFSKDPIVLPRRDYCLRLVQRLRDEAHRFAVTYHRSTREKNGLKSSLTEIDGIGEKRRKALMEKFGTIENIKRATREDLLEVDGIYEKQADAIIRYFGLKKENK